MKSGSTSGIRASVSDCGSSPPLWIRPDTFYFVRTITVTPITTTTYVRTTCPDCPARPDADAVQYPASSIQHLTS